MVQEILRDVDVATTALEHNFSINSLLLNADSVVKFVVALLLIASLVSWAIIFDKIKKYRSAQKAILKFEKDYRASNSLSSLYNQSKKQINNPLAAMFVAGMYEINDGIIKKTNSDFLNQKIFDRVYHSMSRVKNKFLERMEKDLIFLATTASAAPFIGLFGTVWGIVNSFQAIAATKNTSLAVVAPGIAEALIATGIGLFAAIPAAIYYNILSNRVRITAIKLDDFSNELSSVIIFSNSN